MMTNKPCIVFDMDGVLIDSERIVCASWELCGPKYGIANPTEFFRSCMGTTPDHTRRRLLDAYGEDFPYDAFVQERRNYYYDIVRRTGVPKRPYVCEAIAGLHELGFPLAVASSTRESLVREELGEIGVLPYFSVVIGGDKLQRSKPAPDIYLLACETLGTNPASAYAVEDSYNGIRSAASAGMMPIMIPDQQPATDEMRSLCRYLFDDLGELYAHFQREFSR